MLQLPKNIERYLSKETYQLDNIGMSDSSVLLFQDKVLKIQEDAKEADNEYRMMNWLEDKLKVPRIYAYELWGGKSYLLMERLKGEMACSDRLMSCPDLQAELLAKALENLWNVDVADCPCDWSLKVKLEQAKYNVEHHLVDMENVEPETFGEKGFQNPEALLFWLYENQPEEEPVLSHGDFCLPNIFFENNTAGYIDLGKTGIADKWCDIAICYRSLRHNYSGKYSKAEYDGKAEYAASEDFLLFEKLGISPDWEKIRYYILLDELF